MLTIRSVIVPVAVYTLLCIIDAPLPAQTYTFQNLADTNGPFATFSTLPVTGANGHYVFQAELDSGVSGLFSGPNPATDTVADSTVFETIDLFPDVNASGTVVFTAQPLGEEPNGIYTGPDPVTDELIDNDLGFFSFSPVINDAGTLAVSTVKLGPPLNETFIVVGTDPTTDVYVDEAGPFLSLAGLVAINNSGDVVFQASLDGGGQGLFSGPDPLTDTIVDTSGPFSMITGVPMTLLDDGQIFFAASLDSGVTGVFTGPDPTTDTFLDDSGPIDFVLPPSFNSAGQMVFTVSLDNGDSVILSGTDLVADKILQTGDPLFGSTVITATLLKGIDETGGFKFSYELANGIEGVAEAVVVPEPSSWVLMLLAAVGLAVLRRRQC